MNNRDIDRLRVIHMHCSEIIESINRYGADFDVFRNDRDYYKSVSMSLMQIGETSSRLSEEFQNENSEIPWRGIRGMRNMFAHDYLNMQEYKVWVTAFEDIPVLLRFCEEKIRVDESLTAEGFDE